MSKLQKVLEHALPADWLEGEDEFTHVRALAPQDIMFYDPPKGRMRNLSHWSVSQNRYFMKMNDVIQRNSAVNKLLNAGKSPTIKQALMVITRTLPLNSSLSNLDPLDERVQRGLMSILNTLTAAMRFLHAQSALSDYASRALDRAPLIKSALIQRMSLRAPIPVRDNVHHHSTLMDPDTGCPTVYVFTLFKFAMVAVSLAHDDHDRGGFAWYLFQDTRTASHYLHVAGYKVVDASNKHLWYLSQEFPYYGVSAASDFTAMIKVIILKMRTDGYDARPAE